MSDLALFIACPNCKTTFRVKQEALPTAGRDVRCSSCAVTWHVNGDGSNGAIHQPKLAPLVEEAEAEAEADDVSDIIPTHLEQVDAPSLIPVNEVPLSYRKVISNPKPLTNTARKQVPVSVVAVIMAVVALIGFIVGRETILRNYPQSATVYAALGFKTNLTDLEFKDVVSSRLMQNNQDVLVIEGQINNIAKDRRTVPQLRLIVRNKQGKEIYYWTANATKSTLEGGETQDFRARLAQPPEGAHDVVVKFNSEK